MIMPRKRTTKIRKNKNKITTITKIHYQKGRHFEFASHINEFLIPREKTAGSETFLVIIRPKQSTHLHRHPDMEQVFYVIRGRGVIWIKGGRNRRDKKRFEIKPGDVVFIPLNNWHRIACAGGISLEYLCFNAFPKGFLPGESTALAHASNVLAGQKNKKSR